MRRDADVVGEPVDLLDARERGLERRQAARVHAEPLARCARTARARRRRCTRSTGPSTRAVSAPCGQSWTPPADWLIACAAPALSVPYAMPPSVAACAICVRASTFEPSSTAVRSHAPTSSIALQGDGVVEGLVVVARVALDRVRERVHPRRRGHRGRKAEHELGIDERDVRPDQRRAADVELDLALVVRDDRPERHLAAGAGRRRDRDERRDAGRRSDRGPTRSRGSSRRARRRRRSTWPCRSTSRRRGRRARRSPTPRRARAPSSTSAMSGFGRTWSKTTASASCSSALSARPAAATPGSVTSRGRVTPSSWTISASFVTAPAPWTSLVGTSTERIVSTSTGMQPPSRSALAPRSRVAPAPTLGVLELVEREDMEAADVGPLLTEALLEARRAGPGRRSPRASA